MEILVNEGMCFGVGTLGVIVLIIEILGIIFFLVEMAIDASEELILISLGFALIATIASLLFTNELYRIPTGEYTYVVEITDETKYKELVEEGYTFKRVYENKEIYSITGGELE